MDDFKDRLKQALSIRNMKPIQLAEKLDINRAVVSQYLSGRYKPNHHRIYEIASVLHVDEAWLLGLDVPMESEKDDEVIDLYKNNISKFNTSDKKNILKFIKTILKERNK